MKKTVFFKLFFNNIIIIIISTLILAMSGYVLISHTVYRERVETLKGSATAISGFINSDVAPERLESFIYGFSHSTGNSIIIIDNKGKILMVSTVGDFYSDNVAQINMEYCKDVLSGKDHINRGTLGGVYKTEMFTLQMPVVSTRPNKVVGAIFISSPAPKMLRMQLYLYRTLGIAIVCVLLLSLLISYALSKKISKPIKDMGKAAKKFAKGDFSSRVEPGKKGYNITEIEELTKSFNDMAFSLEKAEDIRNNFISDVSHELRTPMTTIGGFVDGILDGTIPPERQNDYLAIVKDEVSRLSALVNSFLDVTRNESGGASLELSNFDVNEIIRRMMVNFESKISEKEIFVDIDFDAEQCLVKADLDAIKRVLTNLIENAIKFTNQKGMIRISVKTKQQNAEISVYNTGCGISEDDKKLIFERFYKVDKSRSLNREGTGIGLYIVKEIINRHGKHIEVRSVENEYAEFVFTLDKGKG
ncbi:MAG: HAMP domain-containing histidine kinase [Clostridia bacterium]|nr:HAMP domain-containing histidine kinase [Clostridia bacterium]